MFVLSETSHQLINLDHVIRIFIKEGKGEYEGIWAVLADTMLEEYYVELGKYNSEDAAYAALSEFTLKIISVSTADPKACVIPFRDEKHISSEFRKVRI